MSSREAAEQAIEDLKKEYHDARHVCYAWRLGADGEDMKAYDAGEPAHSAGDPILNSIRSHDLTNIIIIVIRYFGGTKLGIPGLIEAYQAAAEDAISQNKIVIHTETTRISIRFPYEKTSEINRILHHASLHPAESSYEADCTMKIDVPVEFADELREKFSKLDVLD